MKEMTSSRKHISLREPISTTRFCLKCQRLVTNCPCLNLLPPAEEDSEDDCIFDIESQPGKLVDIASPTCPKSHQHDEFIPTIDVQLNDLPLAIRHPAVIAWLKYCFPLVVRITRSSVATGRACIIPEENKIIKCENTHCSHRQYLGPNHELYGGIGIITNKHVVDSDEKAAMTIVEFFYDDEDTRHWSVTKEVCAKILSTNKVMDYTVLSCFVHYQEVVDIIKMVDDIKNYCWLKIPKQIRLNSMDFAIVISHPHGASKQLSIGEKIGTEVTGKTGVAKENSTMLLNIFNLCEKTNGQARFAVYFSLVPDIVLPNTKTWYTTATCKGSSGAPVYMGNVVYENGQEINQAHTHRGVDSKKGWNNCYI